VKKLTTGRAVSPIMVRPRTSAQRECLARAAKKAGVSLSYYLLESALMVAAAEGHRVRGPAGWEPPALDGYLRDLTRSRTHETKGEEAGKGSE
jgi:hypothetical protein